MSPSDQLPTADLHSLNDPNRSFQSALLAVCLCASLLARTTNAEEKVRIESTSIGRSSYNGPGLIFRKGHPARFEVILNNPSNLAEPGELDAEIIGNLETIHVLAPRKIVLGPRSRRSVTLSWDYPGAVIYEGIQGGTVRIPGPIAGHQLRVAWRTHTGSTTAGSRMVFGIEPNARSPRAPEDPAGPLGPAEAFSLRYSGYLRNPAILPVNAPEDFSFALDRGKVLSWSRGPGPAGHDTCILRIAANGQCSRAVLEHKTGTARLLRAWLLDTDRPQAPRSSRLPHVIDLKASRFQIPSLMRDALLILELGPSHYVAPVPIDDLARAAEKKTGPYRGTLSDLSGRRFSGRDEWSVERTDLRRRVIRALGADRESKLDPLDPILISEEVVPPRFAPTGWVGGYTRSLVSIQLRRGERMNLWLLIPAGLGPFPAVLTCHQTVAEGKDEPVGLGGNIWQLDFGTQLASRGYVVAAADSRTFGERFDPLVDSGLDTTRFEQADPSWSLLGRRLEDHRRTLDYLVTLPIVSPDCIGVMGHSLGGESAAMVMAIDERIRAGVVSCGFTLLQTLENAAGIYAAKGHSILPPSWRPVLEAPPGKRSLPFDFDDIMALWIPRPVFFHDVTEELRDFTSAPQTLQAAAALRSWYRNLGADDRFKPIVSAQAHCFPLWVQADAIDWLDYWLRPSESETWTGQP